MALNTTAQQPLGIRDAVSAGLANYGTIKAKASYLGASQQLVKQSKREYIPNVNLSAQQDFGTVNGQNGPLYGFGGFGVASSGLPLTQQNWNAGFGALYLANVNWDFFTFGRVIGRVKIAKAVAGRDDADLQQEQFQHQVKVASAYLNLLAAQRLTLSQQKNLERAQTFKNTAVTRAANGLIAGVDSSLAAAEVSGARIALTKAKDFEQEQANKLAVLMGIPAAEFVLDTAFISRIPVAITAVVTPKDKEHPLLKYYQSRISYSDAQLKYYKKLYYPTFSMFGVIQGRGSGFEPAYTQDQTRFSQSYGQGVSPVRANYLVGVGMNWNLTTILRTTPQVKSQKLVTQGLQDEYDLAGQQLKAQADLAELKIKNALANYAEAPQQVRAAQEAYLQKSTLYRNGLTNIVDVTQAQYTLNRAETDRDIAYNNVWQALLFKAAATGDISVFMNEF
jgi:outer membrane protein TolC